MGVPIFVVSLGSKIVEKKKLDQEVISIGRAQENDIVINNLSVSRYHAVIYNKGGRVVIKDLGSANGTFVNGAKIDESELWLGDAVLVGKHLIKFSRDEDSRAEDRIAFQEEGGTVMVDARTQEKLLERLKNDPFKVAKLILSDGREVELNSDYFTVGKADNSSLKIDGFLIKSPHVKIIKLPDGSYRIISMGSFLRPSTVNGNKVKERVLRDGDIIKIGGNEMMFVTARK